MKKIITSAFTGYLALAFVPVASVRAIRAILFTSPYLAIAALIIVLGIVISSISDKLDKKIWTWKDLGVRTDNINWLSILLYGCVAYVFCKGFTELYPSTHTNPLNTVSICSAVLVVAAQQVICSSYMRKRGKEIFEPRWITIPIIAVLFTSMHLVYPSLKSLDYAFLGIGGIAFASMYYFWPNLLLICCFHLATNLMALHLGMFKPVF